MKFYFMHTSKLSTIYNQFNLKFIQQICFAENPAFIIISRFSRLAVKIYKGDHVIKQFELVKGNILLTNNVMTKLDKFV